MCVSDDWIGRRLAPDCSRIELSSLPRNRDEQVLVTAMGFETGNMHLGTEGAAAVVLKALRRLPEAWLLQAAELMYEDTLKDCKVWRKHCRTLAV